MTIHLGVLELFQDIGNVKTMVVPPLPLVE